MFRAFSSSSAAALAFDSTGGRSLPLYRRRMVPPPGGGSLRDWSHLLDNAGRSGAFSGEDVPVFHRAFDDANSAFAVVAAF
jgi:hypothetical protein